MQDSHIMEIAIDGASRRNGKPDCVSAGGAFVTEYNKQGKTYTLCLSASEIGSTNQRGELLALIMALSYVKGRNIPTQIITDSEYLFNAMTKGWPMRWSNFGWTTAAGDEVKNKDLWQQVVDIYSTITTDVVFYHIKGHVIPYGKVAARKLLDTDEARLLFMMAMDRIDELREAKASNFEAAQELSEKNNGFRLPEETLRRFVASNVVADAIATKAVEEADRNI